MKRDDAADDGARLARLVEQLASDARYASGNKRFPGRVTRGDAAAIAAALAEEVDAGTAARAEAARAQGYRIACESGCNACCEVLVLVYEPEAVAIARWLRQPENAEARGAFLAAFDAWRARVGDLPERLTALFVKGDTAAFDALGVDAWRARVLCAFNRDGRCAIYPVRPLGCRNAHALDTNQRCVADQAPAAALAFVPLDDLMKSATRLLRAAHNAMTDRRHAIESVCVAVHRLLTPKR
jgi:hypothetical protein